MVHVCLAAAHALQGSTEAAPQKETQYLCVKNACCLLPNRPEKPEDSVHLISKTQTKQHNRRRRNRWSSIKWWTLHGHCMHRGIRQARVLARFF